MKIKVLEIKNIGMIAETKINFEKSLNLFYGEIRQSKSFNQIAKIIEAEL